MPATYLVLNTADSGAGSLRQAIIDANQHIGFDSIHFDIGLGVPETISLQTPLPEVDLHQPVDIDASTEPHFSGMPLIYLNGMALAKNANGIVINANDNVLDSQGKPLGSRVKGLGIMRFGGDGIKINGANDNRIEGNYIGFDSSGKAAPNGKGISIVNSSGNTIGGTTTSATNVIALNDNDNIHIEGGSKNIIVGNYIGYNPNLPLPFNHLAMDGIELKNSSKNTIGGLLPGERNIISGNYNGIYINGVGSTENTIVGNYIGTDASGTLMVQNSTGIFIEDKASKNYIGGQMPVDAQGVIREPANVISGNKVRGIELDKLSNVNHVLGNFIGTKADGKSVLIRETNVDGKVLVEQQVYGILIDNSSVGNIIGEEGPAGVSTGLNVISGHRHASEVVGYAIKIDRNSTDNKVVNNNIGIGKDPTNKNLDLGNQYGVIIARASANNIFERNLIGFSQRNPVRVEADAGKGNKISKEANSFFKNGADPVGVWLGIDLNGDGLTHNDAGDADTGPNRLQNYPILTAAVTTATGIRVEGTIDSLAGNSTYPITILFFDNIASHPSGYGEGETYLGYIDVTGPGPFSLDLPSGSNITATATDAEGNTSEFSRAIKVYSPNTIGDRVWTDLNANGTWDPFEPGLSGVTVSLYDSTGTFITSVNTNTQGYYLFSGLAPGIYSIGFTAPMGYFFSPKDVGDDTIDSDADSATGRTANFTLAAGGANHNIDAGMYQKGTIGDRVWEDANGNGLQDATEVGRSNVTVQLLNSVGAVLDTATTNASGLYSFPNLVPATYSIKVLVLAGRGFASRDAGTDDQMDSDVDSTGQTAPFNLTSGQNDTSRDAGLTRLIVTSFTPTSTGFIIDFDRLLTVEALNLYYTQAGGFGPADVTLVGNTVGAIKGSLVINPPTDAPILDSGAFTRITFIRTGDVLPADTYTVTLRSASDGFRSGLSGLLDGNNDGTLGDNYTTNFTVAASSAVVVSLPDFARGAGQPVDVPATSTGLPLRLSDGANVTSVVLTIYYDPTLLTITGAAVASGVPAGASVTLDTTVAGRAIVNFTSPTALSAGALDFVKLTATVPTTAPYKGKHVLDITSIAINGGAIASRDNDALHVAAYFGDTTGNRGYSALDAQRVARVGVGLDTGFAAYRSLDPVIIGDITGNGELSGLDATRIMQESVGLDRLEIPPIPAGVNPDPATGPDPYLNIPTAYSAQRGQTVTVAVNLDLSDGLNSLDLAISYDTSRLEVLSVNDIVRGILTYDFGLFAVNLDNPAGVIRVNMARTEGDITGRGSGSLLQITFRIKDDAPTGGAIINLRQSSGATITQLNEGGLDLIPDPSDALGDELDGLITVL